MSYTLEEIGSFSFSFKVENDTTEPFEIKGVPLENIGTLDNNHPFIFLNSVNDEDNTTSLVIFAPDRDIEDELLKQVAAFIYQYLDLDAGIRVLLLRTVSSSDGIIKVTNVVCDQKGYIDISDGKTIVFHDLSELN